MCGDPTLLLLPPAALDVGEIPLTGLRADWEILLGGAGCASPYLTLDWLRAWSFGFGGGKLRLHVANAGGGLAAAIPLVHGRRTLAGLPARVLYSPSLNIAFSDVVVAGGKPALDVLLDGILPASDAHAVLLRGMESGSPQERHLRSYLDSRGLQHTVTSFHEVRIDTSGGIEAYRAGRRKKFWSNVRNRRKRFESLGRVEFERHRSPRDPDGLLAEMCAVSMRSWKFREGTAIALMERFRRFLGHLIATPTADTWMLRLDGRAIAYRVMAVAHGIAGEIEIGYDESYRAFSPGTLLAAESNEALIRDGAVEIGSAGEHAWKDEWSPAKRERLEFVIFLPGRYSRLLARAHAWRVRSQGLVAA